MLLLAACATVPETGRRQLVLTDPNADAQEAALVFQELKKQQKISRSTEHNARVTRVANRIVAVAPVKKTGWEFVVFDEKDPNAFAMPGGKIGVNSGLLRLAGDDAMLAAVLAHEVGHVVANHGSERKSHGLLANIGGTLLDAGLAIGTTIDPSARGIISGAYGAGASLGVILPYSRAHEYEADRLGLIYMARAGYDPEAAIRFWRKMIAYGEKHREGGKLPDFLGTHPADEARISRLEKFMPAAIEEYNRANRSTTGR